jgi:lipopolysaccharide biosynthesis glycosyltransferase
MVLNSRNNNCFVFALDEYYIEQFRVVIYSLIKHNSWVVNEKIYILYSSPTFSSDCRILLTNEILEKYSIIISWLSCDLFIEKNLKIGKSDHVTISTYYRLFINELIPQSIDYALYLDLDILIIGDIKNLYFKEIFKPVAAVDNYAPSESVRLWGSEGGDYFNAGVLLINLKLYRKYNFIQKYLCVLQSNAISLDCWDQDILNYVHKNDWERLPFYYNFTRHMFQSFQIINNVFYRKVIRSGIAILHYDGPLKPWNSKSKGVLDHYWINYFNELRITHSSLKIITKFKLNSFYHLRLSFLKTIIYFRSIYFDRHF